MKRRTYLLWKRIVIRLAIVGVIVGLFFMYFKTNVFTIETYDIQGVDDLHKELLLKKIQAVHNEPILRIFPGNSIFTYHRDAIYDAVYEILPNTETLSIYPPSLHTLTIAISSYKPMFRKEGMQAITKSGIVYKEINDITDLPSIQTASQTQRIPQELLTHIGDIYPKIDTSLFTVGSIVIDENSDIHIKSKEHASEVIINASTSPTVVWSTIVSAIDTEPLKSKLLNQKGALEYLDVRFGNKVFYRFTNDKDPAIIHSTYATSTATTTPH